jgi:hypothetical protein
LSQPQIQGAATHFAVLIMGSDPIAICHNEGALAPADGISRPATMASPGRAVSFRIEAPISIGELIDKITILEIKDGRMTDRAKAVNVAKELALLRSIKTKIGLGDHEIDGFVRELRVVNSALWEIEDEIRELEARGDFGQRFIELARSIYRNNDERARIKHRINASFGSDIVEEKSYKGYAKSADPGGSCPA